jgi:peptidoglycan/LPS O-acetylase OafA/YrhL
VRKEGHGNFAFTEKTLWFSSSDGSDPHTNGRSYALLIPWVPPAWSIPTSWAVFGVFSVAWLIVSYRQRSPAFVARTADHLVAIAARDCSASSLNHPSSIGSGRREWSLDLIRAAAVLLVLAHHNPFLCPVETSSLLHGIEQAAAYGGWVGVDLFFVLSGYLVSGLLFAEYRQTGRIRVGRFLFRRGFKIYPSFWLMIIATLAGGLIFRLPPGMGSDHLVDRIIGDLLFLQNYVGDLWGHTWTLAVEEHFYFLLVFLFVISLESRRPGEFKFLIRVALGAIIVCPAIRCIREISMGHAYAYTGNYFSTHTRIDSLMCGLCLRWWKEIRPDSFIMWIRRGSWGWLAASVVLLAPFFMVNPHTTHWMMSVGLCVTAIGAVCLVLSSHMWRETTWLRIVATPLLPIGRHSYSIYLWHMMIIYWLVAPAGDYLRTHWSHTWWFAVLLLHFGSTIGLGMMSGWIIEQPFLRLRDRWFRSPTRHEAPPERPSHELPNTEQEALS